MDSLPTVREKKDIRKSRDKEKYKILAKVIEGGSDMVAAVRGYLHCIKGIPVTRKTKATCPLAISPRLPVPCAGPSCNRVLAEEGCLAATRSNLC